MPLDPATQVRPSAARTAEIAPTVGETRLPTEPVGPTIHRNRPLAIHRPPSFDGVSTARSDQLPCAVTVVVPSVIVDNEPSPRTHVVPAASATTDPWPDTVVPSRRRCGGAADTWPTGGGAVDATARCSSGDSVNDHTPPANAMPSASASAAIVQRCWGGIGVLMVCPPRAGPLRSPRVS